MPVKPMYSKDPDDSLMANIANSEYALTDYNINRVMAQSSLSQALNVLQLQKKSADESIDIDEWLALAERIHVFMASKTWTKKEIDT